jgi:membrane protease YdiL (CAAX protease family)
MVATMQVHSVKDATRSAPTATVRSAAATSAIRRRPLEAFFVLAFTVSWAPLLVRVVAPDGPLMLGCGPFIAAMIVVAVTGGRTAVRPLLQSMTRWRLPARWWAVTVVVPIVVTGVAAALNVVAGAERPDANDLGRWTGIGPTVLLILLVPIVGGAWEEPGWRGYALPALLKDRSPIAASMLLGSIWAVWHLPLFVAGEQHWSDIGSIIAVTIVMTWLFGMTAGSVLVAMVFHAVNNAVSGEFVSPMFTGADSLRQSWLLAAVWTTAALLVVVVTRGRLLPPPGRSLSVPRRSPSA